MEKKSRIKCYRYNKVSKNKFNQKTKDTYNENYNTLMNDVEMDTWK